jgi:hypothetical protein
MEAMLADLFDDEDAAEGGADDGLGIALPRRRGGAAGGAR